MHCSDLNCAFDTCWWFAWLLTWLFHAGDDEEEEDEEEDAEDRAFLDDRTVHVQAGFRDIADHEERNFRRVGAGDEERDERDPKQKNKDRQPPRELQHSKERANYRSLAL